MIFRKRPRAQAGAPPPPPILRCSFCNKSQHDVEKLIAGPAVYICKECVAICNDIIAEDRLLVPQLPTRPPLEDEGGVLQNPPQAPGPLRCKLCGLPSVIEFCLPVPSRGWVCGACLDAVREVLEASKPEA